MHVGGQDVQGDGKTENSQIDQQALCPLGGLVKVTGDHPAEEGLHDIHGQADLSQEGKNRAAEKAGMAQHALSAEADHHQDEQEIKDGKARSSVHGTAHIGQGKGQAGQGGHSEQHAHGTAADPSPDPTAQLKGGRSHGDLREGADVCLVGKKEPVLNVTQ